MPREVIPQEIMPVKPFNFHIERIITDEEVPILRYKCRSTSCITADTLIDRLGGQ